MNIKSLRFVFSTLLLYALSFLLLTEWLRPIDVLTENSHFWVFFGFIALSLLLSFLRVPVMIGFLIRLLYILYMIQSVYYHGPFLQLSWAVLLLEELLFNLELVWTGQWLILTDPFRTILFFVFLWMITYLIHHWLIKQKRIFTFFLLTILFITMLDTFSSYEGDVAIIRTVITGFLLMGMLTYQRIGFKRGSLIKKWLPPLFAMIAGSVVIGYIAPKAEPIWPDPVPFIQSFHPEAHLESGFGSSAGYGTDDSNLGGPMNGDDSVVFTAEVEERHYWKVETKDIYTGKGWMAVEQQPIDMAADDIPIRSFRSVPAAEKTSVVSNVMSYPHIQYPHGVVEIEPKASYWYRLNPTTQKILSFNEAKPEAPESFKVHYQKPIFPLETLLASYSNHQDVEFQSIKSRYTQLPEDLPTRVSELAKEITADHETVFDRVKAVEEYFSKNGFVYDQVNVAVPGAHQDYVDQFLFETQRGYCDNFSTSMVVLLRTLDIPARWAKGYTAGEYIETTSSGNSVYEITNNNAHSWVEVYFPEVGWVPFEPTVGFSNNVEFASEAEGIAGDQEETREVFAPEQEKAEVDEAQMEAESADTPPNPFGATSMWIVGLLASLAIAYFVRVKWLPFYYLYVFRKKQKDETFPRAYRVLLAQLDRKGLHREQGQTLREYAIEVDALFGGNEMMELTAYYERFLYRGILEEGIWLETKGTWESLIKKTGA